MRKPPPRKEKAKATGPRRINGGVLLDVAGAAGLLGETQNAVRAQVARQLLPFKRLGGRVVFLRSDVEAFLAQLPGVTVEQAIANRAARGGA